MKKKSMPKPRPAMEQPKYPGYDNPTSAFLAGNFAPSMQPVIQQKMATPRKKY